MQDQDDGADQAVIKREAELKSETAITGEAATDSRRVRTDVSIQKDEAVKAENQPLQQGMPPLDAAEQLAPSERRALLLDCLRQKGPMQADDLACTLAMPVSEMNAMLVGLEMLGQVRRLPGARYEAGV